MADRTQDKQTGPSKSFMTVGPTLHYSHANVRRCWGLAILVFPQLLVAMIASFFVIIGGLMTGVAWSMRRNRSRYDGFGAGDFDAF